MGNEGLHQNVKKQGKQLRYRLTGQLPQSLIM